MLLFWKLVDKTQMPRPQEYIDTFILIKKCFLVGLRGLQSMSNSVERPCMNISRSSDYFWLFIPNIFTKVESGTKGMLIHNHVLGCVPFSMCVLYYYRNPWKLSNFYGILNEKKIATSKLVLTLSESKQGSEVSFNFPQGKNKK